MCLYGFVFLNAIGSLEEQCCTKHMYNWQLYKEILQCWSPNGEPFRLKYTGWQDELNF